MKCRSCDCVLTDFESTRKSASSGEYLDLCNSCFSDIKDDIEVIVRPDLEYFEDITGEEYE